MSESGEDLVKRMTRLLDEELSARGIGFTLVVALPDGDQRRVGITSNIAFSDAAMLVTLIAYALERGEAFATVSSDDYEAGHA